MRSVLLLFIVVQLLSSCTTTETNTHNTTISGTIERATDDYLKLYRYASGINYNFEIVDSVQITPAGQFNLALQIDAPFYGFLFNGIERTMIYLEPGDQLQLSADGHLFNPTLTYEGKGSAHNNYFAEIIRLESELDEQFNRGFDLTPGEFEANMQGWYSAISQFQDQYFSQHQVNDTFKLQQQLDVQYTSALTRIDYGSEYLYYGDNDTIDLPPSYWQFMDAIDLGNDLTLYSPQYIDLVYAICYHKAMDQKINPLDEVSENGFYEALYQVIKTEAANQPREIILTKFLIEQVKYNGVNAWIDSMYIDYKALVPNVALNEALNNEYQKWLRLTPGVPAPNFSYPDVHGNMVTLSDFRGKLVYIDAWATWCGPCKEEIPYMYEVMQHFKDRDDIVFLNISLDDKKGDWEREVSGDASGSIHLFAQGFGSDFAQNYNIDFIPRYLLIDQQGNIIDVHADRPSENIQAIIESHLKAL